MTMFTVKGPFSVELERTRGGRCITRASVKEFCALHSDVLMTYGCYVFAMRHSRRTVPLYVGQTTRSFRKEAFTDHKIKKAQAGVADYKRGTLVVFFIVPDKKRGRKNRKDIRGMENLLIQNAVARNPRLQNVHGTNQEKWGVRGVLRSPAGKPSTAAVDFGKMMKF